MADITQATNAYATTLKTMTPDAATPEVAGGFGELLKASLESAINAQHKSEQVSAQALIGKADMTDVLQAITSAEIALNSVLSIRDKVVSAYDSLMRTQI